MLHRNGFGVLLMDQRDHGDSDDEDLRFAAGIEEYLDVLGAWDCLVAAGVPEDRIGVLGMSFGAATSVIAGGEEPRVRAVWEDSSFGDMVHGDARVPRLRGLPGDSRAGGELVARIVAGDDLTAKTRSGRCPPTPAGRSRSSTGEADILVSRTPRSSTPPPWPNAWTCASTGSCPARPHARRGRPTRRLRAPPDRVLHGGPGRAWWPVERDGDSVDPGQCRRSMSPVRAGQPPLTRSRFATMCASGARRPRSCRPTCFCRSRAGAATSASRRSSR